MRRLALFVFVAAVASPDIARALCNFSGPSCPNLVATCCGATSCTLDGTITLPAGVCTLDFGSRAVTLSGTLVLPSEPPPAPHALPNIVEIRAGQFHVTGKLTSNGNPGSAVSITRAIGGTLDSFTIEPTGAIDLSGHGDAGSLTIDADGPILLGGSGIRAAALDVSGSGGSLDISTGFSAANQDAITVDAALVVDGSAPSLGGGVSLAAGASQGNLTLTTRGSISARGDSSSVTIDLGGKATFRTGSLVDVGGLAGSGGDGGQIEVTAAAVDALGSMSADGGGGTMGNGGGDGGEIDLTALTGALNVTRPVGVGLLVDGALGAMGGTIDLETDSTKNGAVSVGAILSAQGSGGANLDSGGGTVIIDAGAALTVTKKIDVSASAGEAGEVDLTTDRGDISLNAVLNGTSPITGGSAVFDGSRDVLLNADVLMRGQASTQSAGGSVSITAARDTTVASNVDASGSLGQPGGDVDIEAGRNLSITGPATVRADGGSTGFAGTIRLFGGSPSYTGNLTVTGTVTAVGPRDPTQAPTRFAIDLEACQVTIAPGGTVDSTGDASKRNFVLGRSGIAVNGNGKLRSGANTASYLAGTTPTFGPGVSPAIACACPVGPPAASCCEHVPCTAPGDPIDCLLPCPACGDGAVTFPETCDIGHSNDLCSGCDLHCRALVKPNKTPAANCADTVDSKIALCLDISCDQAFGCNLDFKPEGSSCSDGDACNGAETCQSGACVNGEPPDCGSNPCTKNCDAGTGCLANPPPLQDGITPSGCQDGNPCNGVEACKSGACSAGTPVNCDDNDAATLDSCKVVGGQAQCQHADPPPCALDIDCAPLGVCDICDQNTHKCRQAPDGASCSDGDKCNGAETCVKGSCVAGSRLDCESSDPCVATSCDALIGCVSTPIPGCCETPAAVSTEPVCNDSNKCTTDGCSDDHVCTHPNIPNCCAIDSDCSLHTSCSQDTCDKSTDPPKCVHTNVNEGQACGNDVCTSFGATCQAGKCSGGQALQCPQHNDICINDSCDSVDGCKSTDLKPQGCCKVAADCEDHDACTVDVCEDNLCRYADAFPNCESCQVDTDCTPSGRCQGRACQSGVCVDVAPPSCPNGTACHLDASSQPVCRCTKDVACDDGNACNGAEHCDGASGTCLSGAAPSCDDGNVCTDDSCDPAQGCVHTGPSGFAGVTTHLQQLVSAANGGGAADITSGLKKGIAGKASTVQAKLNAASDAAGHSTKREGKLLKAASTNLKKLGALIAKGRKGKKPKISKTLADTLTARLGCASGALGNLQTTVTTR